jgi:anti-sigma factor RsiW
MVNARHPDVELIASLRGDLSGSEARQVAAHVERCPECQRAAGDYRTLLDALAGSPPPVPPISWGAYRAEVRARVDAGRDRRSGWQWLWSRPVPLAMAAGIAALLIIFAVQRTERLAPGGSQTVREESVRDEPLDPLQQYSFLEQLDLLENFEVIRQLDRLPESGEG